MNKFRKIILTGLLASTMMLSACSTAHDSSAYEDGIYDPWESYNRAVFTFNEGVDYVVLDPVTEAYRFVVPSAFRTAISNFLFNLKHPLYLINELMQGDMDGASLVTKRFVFNTFTGFGGILDTASWEGMDYQPEDFGQTLAVWGVESGPYMVLPIFGPSSLRDASGLGVDYVMDPVNWYIWDNDKDDLGNGRMAATVLTTKDQYMDLQHRLKKDSVDYYAAVRSVWAQRRNAMINDGQADDNYGDYE